MEPAQSPTGSAWDQSTFETIRKRLTQQSDQFNVGLTELNTRRKSTFGSQPSQLVTTEHIISEHNCVPIDMVALGHHFLFGFNVRFGLKTETNLEDVFSIHRWDGSIMLQDDLNLIASDRFQADFKSLYKYYKHTRFYKFSIVGPYLFMVFQVSLEGQELKTFKWVHEGDQLKYVDNRSDHEFVYPNQFDFQWTRTTRDSHSSGLHPHVSIEDRVFVETIGGDLTIKVEDNTESGAGIYTEPVEQHDQTLDDADIRYAIFGHLIFLKIRPFQEKSDRYFIFNEKLKTVHRADGMADCCLLLPSDSGLVFSSGTYSINGNLRVFENQIRGLKFERKISAPNGEDYLYVFFQPQIGVYVLMSYNLIAAEMGNPIQCHGYSLFEDGQLLFFRADDEPQKHHAIQIWNTPYNRQPAVAQSGDDPMITKIGNRDLVRFLGESNELIKVVRSAQLHESFFRDLVKMVDQTLEAFHWIQQSEIDLIGPLKEIRSTSQQAIEVYEKVLAYQRDAKRHSGSLEKLVKGAIDRTRAPMPDVSAFLSVLTDLRQAKGAIESHREKPYMDLEHLAGLNEKATHAIQEATSLLVTFLLSDSALDPYANQLNDLDQELTNINKAAEGRELEKRGYQLTADLELLLDILNRIEVEDATQISAILEHLTLFFQKLNHFQARLKQSLQAFSESENQVAFAAQLNLFQQNLTHLIEAADNPESCDQNLNRLIMHLEEMETRFADSTRFLVILAERREELITAFENRRFGLLEKRNQQVQGVFQASERIVQGIKRRLESIQSEEEINTFLASDLMVEKLHSLVDKLRAFGDEVRAEEIDARFKATRNDALRQWRDKRDLYNADNSIRLGKHTFSTQSFALDVSLVQVQKKWGVQVTGTQFFEQIEDQQLIDFQEVWQQESAIESESLYAGCVLAHQVLTANAQATEPDWPKLVDQYLKDHALSGYVKGVHDQDAAKIASALWQCKQDLGSLVFSPETRGRVCYAWHFLVKDEDRQELLQSSAAFQALRLQPTKGIPAYFLQQCHEALVDCQSFVGAIEEAAQFLGRALLHQSFASVSQAAFDAALNFKLALKNQGRGEAFLKSVSSLANQQVTKWELCLGWLNRFDVHEPLRDEVAAMLLSPIESWIPNHTSERFEVSGLAGNHSTLQAGVLSTGYRQLVAQLRDHCGRINDLFNRFQQRKKEIISQWQNQLKLDRFRPRVLTSFVRNRLIDTVYLPMVGDNLAKQIGASGDQKRTDLMGLLLLVSPPGYGKTTLIEYIADRLGLVFVKINGPSIGHAATSLDPAEAPHASAREEIEKLNLAFQLGDNVMIYLDDIQHCNPELLQKFISLCDAQRRIEGVWKGESVSYDLRGRKVCVVMAGNPYTESGARFQIPDMLANRADTYNLGDVIGGEFDAFKRSYVENCMTSNQTLAQIARSYPQDIHHLLDVAEGRDEFDPSKVSGDYASTLVEDAVRVARKLIYVRECLLKVNSAYMESAAQADEYRTEPAFKLQGSYRNMNKISEKVLAITDDAELDAILLDHYENEAQTLAKGTESNMLKFRELMGWQSDEQVKRWQDIKKDYARNAMFRGSGENDSVAQMLTQMVLFQEGLERIGKALRVGVRALQKPAPEFPKQIESQWSEPQWQELLNLVRQLAPQEDSEFVVDKETGLPSGFLERHGFNVKKLGGSHFEIRRHKGVPVDLNARGTQLSYEVDLGQLLEQESEQLIKQLRSLNRRIYPVSFSAKGIKNGGHSLKLQVKVEKADMNGLKWLSVFDALQKASDYATKILQSIK